MDLTDQAALTTGGIRGIGAAICRGLGRYGALMAFAARHDGPTARQVIGFVSVFPRYHHWESRG